MLVWLREKRWQSLGFGGMTYLVLLVPLVNVLGHAGRSSRRHAVLGSRRKIPWTGHPAHEKGHQRVA